MGFMGFEDEFQHESGIKALQCAVVFRALEDMVSAVNRINDKKVEGLKREQAKELYNDCLEFFRSEWFLMITPDDLDVGWVLARVPLINGTERHDYV